VDSVAATQQAAAAASSPLAKFAKEVKTATAAPVQKPVLPGKPLVNINPKPPTLGKATTASLASFAQNSQREETGTEVLDRALAAMFTSYHEGPRKQAVMFDTPMLGSALAGPADSIPQVAAIELPHMATGSDMPHVLGGGAWIPHRPQALCPARRRRIDRLQHSNRFPVPAPRFPRGNRCPITRGVAPVPSNSANPSMLDEPHPPERQTLFAFM